MKIRTEESGRSLFPEALSGRDRRSSGVPGFPHLPQDTWEGREPFWDRTERGLEIFEIV